jgi:hypothetical protein
MDAARRSPRGRGYGGRIAKTVEGRLGAPFSFSGGEQEVPIRMFREQDISYPAICCDRCGHRIVNASGGTFHWNDEVGDDPDGYALYFLDHACHEWIHQRLQQLNGQHFKMDTPFGVLDSSSVYDCCLNLEYFPFYLGRTLGLAMSPEGEADNLKQLLRHSLKPETEEGSA